MQLLLFSKNHNGLRYFPYTGYLGVSNVSVEGVIATKLDADLKPLPAKQISVSVRCYEFRMGRIGGVVSSRVVVDQTQVLWSRPEYCELGEEEFPFKIVIPPRVGGFSTVSFVEYKCVWRVEATIHHIHISGVGSRLVKHIDLPLVRYDLPSFSAAYSSSQRIITKPKAPTLRYLVSAPQTPIGPSDLLPITIHVLPEDPKVVIRSATVVVERRIQFNDTQSSPSLSSAPIPIPKSPSVSSLMSYSPPHSLPSPAASTLSLATTETITRPLLPPPPKNRYTSDSSESLNTLSITPPTSNSVKTIVLPIAGSESLGAFSQLDETGAWTKTLTVQWPSAKPSSRWGIGETVVGSELVSIRFFAKTKLIVTTPQSTDSYELEEEEIVVTCTTDAERKLAQAKVHSSSEARSKSKSPRRTRRKREGTPDRGTHTDGEREQVHPPAQFPSASEAKANSSTSSSRHTSKPPPVPRIPRRPHTSAGPRDSSHKLSFSPSPPSPSLSPGFAASLNSFASPSPLPVPGHSQFELAKSASTNTSNLNPTSASTSAARSTHVHSLASPSKKGLGGKLKRPATVGHSGTTQLTPSNVFGHVFSPTSSYSMSASATHPPSSYTAPTISSAPSTSSGSSAKTTSTFLSTYSSTSSSSIVTSPISSENEDSIIKEWEAELAKIEAKSRRGSDLLGFGWIRGGIKGALRSNDNASNGGNKRKRAMTATSLVKPPSREVLLQTWS
ncbi:hypothetical protein GYMLUDRAFT_74149 [Collybiopsis luxurians FD-317 M1]|uniref:Uncharacterized protein n=1 Tax=Collybiopsis luxurians FD-317 M1 TaxID=944289 RepID=A0A0D0CUY0_9AGAR|nr:hypothetical protein GYMLUDRAFT_74149 [Collybiopsis luxurians FD-317 M1]